MADLLKSNYSSDSSNQSFGGSYQICLTITHDTRLTLYSLKPKVASYGTPSGNWYIDVYKADVAGKPTGSSLAQGSYPANYTDMEPGNWYDIVFSANPLFKIPDDICFVFTCPGGDAGSGNYLGVKGDYGSSGASGVRMFQSYDYGANWSEISQPSPSYELYGTALAEPKGGGQACII